MNNRIALITFLIFSLSLLLADNAKAEHDKRFFFNEQLQKFISSSVQLKHQSVKTNIKIADIASWQPAIRVKEEYSSEIENIGLCEDVVGDLSLCDIASPLSTTDHPKKGATISINADLLTKKIADLAQEVESEPTNGRFIMSEEGKLLVVQKSKPGYELDIEQTATAVIEAIDEQSYSAVRLVLKETPPLVSTENIDSLGIFEKIGHGESNFAGSPKNRIHNIKVATSKFDGIVLKPQEEFSFTTLLGPVDGESGYKEELVIKENKTIPEFGGGVCQVSTTMFRAALNSGFEITERRNHAYPVQYYSPQGTDATIYLPRPDLKFVNNSPAHILIQSSIEGTKLSFDIYGTSDNREVEIDGPYVTERTPEGTMKTVLYQNVKDQDGSYIVKDIFKSFYDNPDKYHEPQFKEKPDDWSKKQWEEYKVKHGI